MDSDKKTNLFSWYIWMIILVFFIIALITLPILNGEERLFVLISLVMGLVIIIVLISHIHENYVKPLRNAINVTNELANRNYKARSYVKPFGEAQHLSNAINILARHLQEMQFQEKMQSNQWDTIMNNMESGVILIDERGYVHLANRKFITLFEQDIDQFIGHLYYDVLEDKNIHKVVQETFLYEEKITGNIELTVNNEKHYIDIVGAPVINDRKELKGAVLVFHDISDLKRVEEMRKDFVANVSHELKTPITSMRGFSETLLDDESVDEDTRKHFLGIILKESTRLQHLVHDLLELSKIEKEELKLSVKPIHVNEWLKSSLALVKQSLEKKSLELQQDVEPNINAYGDPDLLQQVVLNLLHNAINYTPQGGKIYISIQEDQENIKLQIKDTGMGIPEEAQNRIFERFYRVDSARSRQTGGTGLGLAIVKHIIEAHQGSIHVTSELGKGTCFTVLLAKTW